MRLVTVVIHDDNETVTAFEGGKEVVTASSYSLEGAFSNLGRKLTTPYHDSYNCNDPECETCREEREQEPVTVVDPTPPVTHSHRRVMLTPEERKEKRQRLLTMLDTVAPKTPTQVTPEPNPVEA